MPERPKTQARRRSRSVEEVHKEEEEEEDEEEEEEEEEEQAEEEEEEEEEEQAESSGGDDNNKLSTIVNKGDYASLSHSIGLLGQQIENLDRVSTSRLNGIHRLLLANYNQLLKSNELLKIIHNAEFGSARANKRGSPVTPGAPNSKRMSSRPPLGTAYREQYGQ